MFRLLLLGSLAAYSASRPALAQNTRRIAKLPPVPGGVLVSEAAGLAAQATGQELPAGARVITTSGAKATISYDKGCEVTLGEDRRYTVREQAECTSARAPPLGSSSPFVVLGGARVANVGETLVNGQLGVSPGTGVTGFPPGRVAGGEIHPADDKATQAQKDALVAYDDIVQQTCNTRLTGQDLGGQTLTPGVYCFPSAPGKLNGELVLDAQGDTNGVFIFQVGTTLSAAAKSRVRLTNGAQACNVYWQVADTVPFGREAKLVGTFLSVNGFGIAGSTELIGRAFARTGPVNLDTDKIDASPCILAVAWWTTPEGAALGLGAAVGVGAGIYEVTRSKSPN